MSRLPGHDRLTELARQRAKLQPVEQAALAYARWQGLTHEANVDTDAAKATLDRITDAMEPEQWEGLAKLVGNLDDTVLRGLMSYSLKRSQEQLRAQSQELLAIKPKKRWLRKDKSR